MIGVLTAHRDVAARLDAGDVALLEARRGARSALAIRLGRAARREPRAARPAERAASRGAGPERRARARRRAPAARRRGRGAAPGRRRRLLSRTTASATCSAAPRCTGSTRRSSASSSRPTRGLAGLAIREGRALVAADYAQLADPVPHAAYDGFTDAIVAPMRWSDEVRGVLGVGRRGGAAVRRRATPTCSRRSPGLASLALRNAETFTRSSRQARVQRGFYRIASALGQSLSRAATLDAVAQAAAEALGGASAAVLDAARATGSALARLARAAGGASRTCSARASSGGRRPARARRAQRRVIAAPTLADDDRLPDEWRRVAAAARLPRAARRAGRDAPRRAGRARRRLLRRGATSSRDDDLELARHLADAARGALERSELFEAERSARALAQQLTRTGPAAHDRARPGRRARRGRAAGAGARERRRVRDPRARGRRARRQRRRRPGRRRGARHRAAPRTRGSPATSCSRARRSRSRTPAPIRACASSTRCCAAGNAAYLGVPLAGPEGAPLGVLAVYCGAAAAVARGRGRGDARARGEHVGRALERRAVPARRAREGAQLRDPRQHRRRHRRRRPRRAGRPLERGRREDHRRRRRRRARAHARARCCSARSSRAADTPQSATGSSRSCAAARKCGSR